MDPTTAHSRLASRHEKEDRNLYAEQLTQILSTPQGRRFFALFLAGTQVYSNAFTQDAAITAYNLGLQAVGQRLLSDLSEICPDYYLELLKETHNVNRTRNAEHERIDAGSDRPDDFFADAGTN